MEKSKRMWFAPAACLAVLPRAGAGRGNRGGVVSDETGRVIRDAVLTTSWHRTAASSIWVHMAVRRGRGSVRR